MYGYYLVSNKTNNDLNYIGAISLLTIAGFYTIHYQNAIFYSFLVAGSVYSILLIPIFFISRKLYWINKLEFSIFSIWTIWGISVLLSGFYFLSINPDFYHSYYKPLEIPINDKFHFSYWILLAFKSIALYFSDPKRGLFLLFQCFGLFFTLQFCLRYCYKIGYYITSIRLIEGDDRWANQISTFNHKSRGKKMIISGVLSFVLTSGYAFKWSLIFHESFMKFMK